MTRAGELVQRAVNPRKRDRRRNAGSFLERPVLGGQQNMLSTVTWKCGVLSRRLV